MPAKAKTYPNRTLFSVFCDYGLAYFAVLGFQASKLSFLLLLLFDRHLFSNNFCFTFLLKTLQKSTTKTIFGIAWDGNGLQKTGRSDAGSIFALWKISTFRVRWISLWVPENQDFPRKSRYLRTLVSNQMKICFFWSI